MHYPITDIQANLGSIGSLDIKLPRKDIDTEGRTAIQTSRTTTIVIFFQKILKTNACEASEYFFAMQECNLVIVFV